jgi:hypothetical protein
MNTPAPPPGRPPAKPIFADTNLPTAKELTSDSAWQQFHHLEARQNAGFADTQPADKSLLLEALKHQRRPAGPQGLSVDDVLVEARRNNRVCPQPVFWFQLYDLLPEGPRRPAPPPDGPVWRSSSSLAKRMALRDQLEYADRVGVLPAVNTFLRKMREQDWLHMEA